MVFNYSLRNCGSHDTTITRKIFYVHSDGEHTVPKSLRELFEASRAILKAFPSLKATSAQEIEAIELRLRREFDILCTHLVAMAVAQIRIKGEHIKGDNPTDQARQITDTACTAVSFLFQRHKNGHRAVVEIIRSLFRRNPGAGPVDLFNYLSSAVSRNLRQTAKQQLRWENPWYSCIATCVDFHIKDRARYRYEGAYAIDLEATGNPGGSWTPTSDEVIALCGRFTPVPKKPGEIIDFIFDRLEEAGAFSGKIRKRDLYIAVYRLIAPQLPDRATRSKSSTPEDIRILKGMIALIDPVLDHVEKNYQWRGNVDGKRKAAYLDAGRDILTDYAHFGKRMSSLRAHLSTHVGNLTQAEWKKYKGSFQNFIMVLEQEWAKRLRAL
jgi:hypothetical protein